MANLEHIKADQLAYWNGAGGQTWVARQAHVDAIVEPISRALLARSAPAAGDRVLDVGCGCGTTTLELARLVGPAGRVQALDISEPMLDVARARGRAAGITNIEWRLADAATAPIDEYDLLVSCFGLMFFADPVSAFTHLRRAARKGARMVFVCWRPLAENQWIELPIRAVAPLLPPRPKPDPQAPGMFALADPQRICDILGSAGWAPPRCEKLDLDLDVAAGRGLDEAVVQATEMGAISSWLKGQPADVVSAAIASVRKALAAHEDGASVRMPAAVWLASSRPS